MQWEGDEADAFSFYSKMARTENHINNQGENRMKKNLIRQKIKQKVLSAVEKLMNRSLTVKISVFIYSIVIILFLFLSFFLFGIVGRASDQRLIEEHSKLLKVAILMINSRQQYMIGVADYYALSPDTQNMIAVSNSGLPVTKYPDESRFKTPTIIILSTVFYNAEGEAVYYATKDTSRIPMNQKNNDAFQKMESGQATYVWEYIDHNDSDFMKYDFSPKLCLWRVIRDSNDVHMIGAVAVTIDSRSLLGFDETAQQLSENLIIINSEDQIVYNRSNIELNKEDIQLLSNHSFESDAGLYTADLNCGKFRCSYQAIPSTDFTAIFLHRHTPFSFGIDVVYSYILAGLFLYILSLFPSIILVSKMITKPLVILTRSIQQFAEGKRDVEVQFKYKDEIGLLGKAFNEMVLDNERLRISEYDLRLKNKDAELALMQAQINPHFLYNMLNAIQWQALKSGNKEIADIAYSMAQVFRISLNRGKSIISVKQEFDLVSYYLSLQKYRLGKKISYHIDFDEEVLEYQIPKLILQPLAENSIVHGMAKDSSINLTIFLSASLSEDGKSVHFMVRDNGCGIPEEILQYLPDQAIPPYVESSNKVAKSNRFAVKNIYDRLTLIYGSDFIFRISNDHGTVIELILPVKKMDERSTSNA